MKIQEGIGIEYPLEYIYTIFINNKYLNVWMVMKTMTT